ncbi:hypothetical protein JTB14_007690 [Gonioctena quinquepunctata]|nr:hypothetical protein JTB14_007690 [Gonioctena quinquepunctata]
MSFTNEQTLTLIDLYRVRPILWDPTQMEYRNKNKRHDMMMEIAVALAIDKGDVEKKIKNLQTTFARERKKMKDSRKTGSGCEETYASKWFAYQDMMFLADKNKPRTTVDTEILEESNGTVHENEEFNETEEVEANKEDNEIEGVNNERNPDKQDDVTTNTKSNKKAKKEFQSPKKPMPNKRKYGSHLAASTPVMNEAINLMRSIQYNKAEKDEYSLFGEQVAIATKNQLTTSKVYRSTYYKPSII